MLFKDKEIKDYKIDPSLVDPDKKRTDTEQSDLEALLSYMEATPDEDASHGIGILALCDELSFASLDTLASLISTRKSSVRIGVSFLTATHALKAHIPSRPKVISMLLEREGEGARLYLDGLE
jgi:hypothetical protein